MKKNYSATALDKNCTPLGMSFTEISKHNVTAMNEEGSQNSEKLRNSLSINEIEIKSKENEPNFKSPRMVGEYTPVLD